MTDHQRGIEAATKAWMDDRGIDDRFDHWRGSMEVAISAYLATTEPGKPESGVLAEAVKVKPLIWVSGESRSSIGDLYSVSQLSENVCTTYKNGTAFTGWEPTLDAAKAIAQADYEQRIMSALTTPPQPVEAGGEKGGVSA
jgi:hypothetical protein